MKKIFYALLLILIPSVLFAAEAYYNFPDATSLPDAGRMLLRDGSNNKNITGAKLKDEVRTAISDTALSSQPVSSANPYQRVAEFKDSTGKITSYITAAGTLVIGTPVAIAITSVFPANGATGVDVATVPQVGTNIAFEATIDNLYIQGDSTAPADASGMLNPSANLWNIPASLAPNTTYTIKFLRQSIVQTSGETTSSCGTAMTDNAGVCESTFTTAP